MLSSNPPPEDQAALAHKALTTKAAGAEEPDHPATEPHADEGIQPTSRRDYPPSGAFDAEGQRPVLERSRKQR